MFSISTENKEDVEKWLNLAKDAEGHIFREAKRDEEGYSWGGFADPDGHEFNVLLIEAGM